jgi:hypothetical protein
MSAPKKPIDEEQVRTAAGFGLTQKEVGALLGCSPDTIQRRYSDAYYEGLETAKGSLRRKQYELAMAGNSTMLIWLGKNLLDQSDRTELTGKNGEPLFAPVDREELIGKLIGSGPATAKPLVQ